MMGLSIIFVVASVGTRTSKLFGFTIGISYRQDMVILGEDFVDLGRKPPLPMCFWLKTTRALKMNWRIV